VVQRGDHADIRVLRRDSVRKQDGREEPEVGGVCHHRLVNPGIRAELSGSPHPGNLRVGRGVRETLPQIIIRKKKTKRDNHLAGWINFFPVVKGQPVHNTHVDGDWL